MSKRSHTAYVAYATVVKTQGLKGEVIVTRTHDLPLSYLEGHEVRIVPPTLHDPNRATVSSVIEDERGGRLMFEGIDTLDTASTLVGRTLLALRADLPVDARHALELVGREVVCEEEGTIGRIVEELRRPANDVWVVQGRFGEVLIPVIDEVVLDIPEEAAEPISVHLLPGLIDEEALVVGRATSAGTGVPAVRTVTRRATDGDGAGRGGLPC